MIRMIFVRFSMDRSLAASPADAANGHAKQHKAARQRADDIEERQHAAGEFVQPQRVRLQKRPLQPVIGAAHNACGQQRRNGAHRHALHKERQPDKRVCRAHELHDIDLLAAGEHRKADGIADDHHAHHAQHHYKPPVADDAPQIDQRTGKLGGGIDAVKRVERQRGAVGGRNRICAHRLQALHGVRHLRNIRQRNAKRSGQRILLVAFARVIVHYVAVFSQPAAHILHRGGLGDILAERYVLCQRQLDLQIFHHVGRRGVVEKEFDLVEGFQIIDIAAHVYAQQHRHARDHQAGHKDADGGQSHQPVGHHAVPALAH